MAALLKSVAAVRIFVDNLARARNFYRNVLSLEQTGGDSSHLAFDCGGTPLIVEPVEADDPEYPKLVGRLVSASFTVSDIDATCQAIRQLGGQIIEMPQRQPWGGVLAFVGDPAGNVITLVDT